MRFSNAIAIDAPPDELFAHVSDPERVTPCLPGASVEPGGGPEYLGTMRVKVGPVSAAYRGTVRLQEVDADRRRATMVARATEASGSGGAEATISVAVEEAGPGSRLVVETDVQLQGRIAQLGGRAIEKVSDRMLAQFARNLERAFAAGPDGSAAASPAASGADLVPGLGADALGRLRRVAVPVLAGGVAGYLAALLAIWLLGRRARSGGRGNRANLDEVLAR